MELLEEAATADLPPPPHLPSFRGLDNFGIDAALFELGRAFPDSGTGLQGGYSSYAPEVRPNSAAAPPSLSLQINAPRVLRHISVAEGWVAGLFSGRRISRGTSEFGPTTATVSPLPHRA